MCDWCNKETIGKPMISSYIMRLTCEHCGGSLKEKFNLTYKNLTIWAIKYAKSKGYKKEKLKMIKGEVTIEIFKEWLSEIIIGDGKSKDLYIKESLREGTVGPKEYEDKRRFTFYTNDYMYSISVVERSDKPGYLGCTMGCRKARAGERWTRGSDLPDGILNRNTWDKIKNAIIKNELVKLAPKIEKIKEEERSK